MIVSVTVVLSIVLALLAAVALAKYRFSGRKLVVLMIGILMLPAAGLVILLYVALVRYGLTNQEDPLPTGALTGVIVTFMMFLLPFAVRTLRGFILGVPRELEEAAMVDGSSRLGAFVRILLPLVAPGLVATSVFVFITAWNEYIRERDPEQPVEPHADDLALLLHRHEHEHGLGSADGGVDIDSDSGGRLLPARAAEDRVRADRRLRQGMSSLERLAAACVFPGFEGRGCSTGCDAGLEGGIGGVVLFAWNVESRDQPVP